jgi:hypothetical protein
MIEAMPLDLKIELGKLIHVEKFAQVKKELLASTVYLHGHLLFVSSIHAGYFDNISLRLRPVYFKVNHVIDWVGYPGFIPQYGSFGWAVCQTQNDIQENDFSIAGKTHKVIKEYLLKNESSK